MKSNVCRWTEFRSTLTWVAAQPTIRIVEREIVTSQTGVAIPPEKSLSNMKVAPNRALISAALVRSLS